MKRAARVSGMMEILGNGACVLQLSQVKDGRDVDHTVPSCSCKVPDCAKLRADIVSGVVPSHPSKRNLDKTAINHYINYLQRDAGLPRGMSGGWNDTVQEKLHAWLMKEKKRTRTKQNAGTVHAITDGSVEDPIEEANSDTQEAPDKQKSKGKKAITMGEGHSSKDSRDDNKNAGNISNGNGAITMSDGHSNIESGGDSDSDSSSSSSSSDSSATPQASSSNAARQPADSECVDITRWEPEWHDAFQSLTVLEDQIGESQKKRRILKDALQHLANAHKAWANA